MAAAGEGGVNLASPRRPLKATAGRSPAGSSYQAGGAFTQPAEPELIERRQGHGPEHRPLAMDQCGGPGVFTAAKEESLRAIEGVEDSAPGGADRFPRGDHSVAVSSLNTCQGAAGKAVRKPCWSHR